VFTILAIYFSCAYLWYPTVEININDLKKRQRWETHWPLHWLIDWCILNDLNEWFTQLRFTGEAAEVGIHWENTP
jgi:hypothetical protein